MYENLNIIPWDTAFSDRMSNALKELKEKKKIVCYLYDRPDCSTFRYRVFNICQALTQSKVWHGVYFFACEAHRIFDVLHKFDVIVMCRTKWNFEWETVIDLAKRNGIPLVFDVDDYVFDLEKLPLLVNSIQCGKVDDYLDYWFSYIARINKIAINCQYAITTNNYIAKKIESCFGHVTKIIPNMYNVQQKTRSEMIVANPKKRMLPDSFRLGYFSGSPSHFFDLNSISCEIYEFLNDVKNAELHVFGFMDLPENLKKLVRRNKIKLLPFVDWVSLQSSYYSVDVNIVPLLNNEFTNCKSALKYIESGLVRTLTCATPVYSYSEAIENGYSGCLCNQGQWYDSLMDIHSDINKRNDICSNAFYDVTSKYYCMNFTEEIERIFDLMI